MWNLEMLVIIRRLLTLSSVFLMIFVVLTGVALGWSWSSLSGEEEDHSETLKEIELKIDTLTSNQKMMKFVSINMLDMGVDTVEVSITSDNTVLKTYYIVRREETIEIREKTPENPGTIWKFMPTPEQALVGLDLAGDGLLILDKYDGSISAKVSVASSMWKAVNLYRKVDKENVPQVNRMVERSSCEKCKKALTWCRCSFFLD